MLPEFPRDLIAEMYLDGWQDITTDVFQRDPITIKRGRGSEAAKAQPSNCSLTLKNTSGDWSPNNPMGPYYGLLTRNAPFRLSFRKMTDTFTRTVASGWGTSDTNDVWDVAVGAGSVSASDWAVGSGVATHSVAAANAYRLSLMTGSPLEDAEVRVSCTVAINNITGGPIEPANIPLRAQDTDTYYLVRVSVSDTETLTLSIRLHDTSETELAAVTVSGVVNGVSTKTIDVAAQIEGPMIRAKVWETGETEPAGWHVSASDTTISDPGAVGIRSGVDSANTNTKPILFTYDNFEVRIPRAAGEVAKLTPGWDVSHTDRFSRLEVAGIMRRLKQWKGDLPAAIERYFVANPIQPAGYWPLDDGELSTSGRAAIGGENAYAASAAASVPGASNLVPGKAFGSGDIAAWMKPCVNVDGNSAITCKLRSPVSGSSWTVHSMVRFNGNYKEVLNADLLDMGEFPGSGLWTLWLESAEGTIEVAEPTAGTIIATLAASSIFDGAPHHIGFRAVQNGANVDWSVIVDGAVHTSGTRNALTNPPLQRVDFQQTTIDSDDSKRRPFGHVAMFSGNGPSLSEVYDAMLGHAGETAGRRIERLCSEKGIPFFAVGDLDATQPMGPQHAAPLLDQLEEAADLDGGTLLDPRGAVGVAYRTLASVYTQPAILELDYDAGHIAPDLEPVFDDRLTVNAVTAKRVDGGEFTVEQTSGPLNINDPGDDPDGVGRYESTPGFNAYDDSQLPDIAGWVKHLGTQPEDRFPQVRIDLRASAIDAATADAVLSMGVDDRFTIDGMSTVHQYDTVDQLARGYTEVVTNKYQHSITFNTAPAGPYNVMILDDPVYGRLDAEDSWLDGGENSTSTNVTVTTDSTRKLWTTDPSQFPLDTMIGGERMTVTSIGAGTPLIQNFVSTRSVNGVVKSHADQTPVALADPVYLGVVA